jgi:hypothetical protein
MCSLASELHHNPPVLMCWHFAPQPVLEASVVITMQGSLREMGLHASKTFADHRFNSAIAWGESLIVPSKFPLLLAKAFD